MMKKGVIIGIAILIIGGIVIVASQSISNDTNEVAINESVNEVAINESVTEEPNQFSIELTESVGFTEYP